MPFIFAAIMLMLMLHAFCDFSLLVFDAYLLFRFRRFFAPMLPLPPSLRYAVLLPIHGAILTRMANNTSILFFMTDDVFDYAAFAYAMRGVIISHIAFSRRFTRGCDGEEARCFAAARRVDAICLR